MTQLPLETWGVKALPDAPAYVVNEIDARPGSSLPATEQHHLWRRSFTVGPVWWVELEDGTKVPNVVGLSQESHELVERGGHRIVAKVVDGYVWFYWLTPEDLAKVEAHGNNVYDVAPQYGKPLVPQPGPQGAVAGRAAVDNQDSDHGAMQLTVEGEEVPHDDVCAKHDDEEQCGRCKGTGKIKRKPKTEQPQAPERKKTTLSVRVPKDERENGHEVLETLMEDVVNKLADADLLRDRNKGANYYALVYALAFFIQNFKPEQERAAS